MGQSVSAGDDAGMDEEVVRSTDSPWVNAELSGLACRSLPGTLSATATRNGFATMEDERFLCPFLSLGHFAPTRHCATHEAIMKLATRIIAVSLLIIIVHACVAGYFTVRNAYWEFERQQRETAERVATTMSELLVDAWRTSGSRGVARLLREGGPTRNLGINVRWVWFEENVPLEELPLAPRKDWPQESSRRTVSAIVVDAYGNRKLHTYVPFSLAPGRRGGLEFAGSLAPLDRQTYTAIATALLTTGTIAVLSILVAYLTGINWIARPLQALIAKTKRIGSGDFGKPLSMKHADELGELAMALNDMCRQLELQQSAIREESAQRLVALEQLRHADRLKTVGRLAAGIAHEMGTPLNVVAGRAALISSGKLSAEEIQKSALTIKSEADRITAIVRQLLTFARREKPQRLPIDLAGLVSSTVNLLTPLAQKQQIQMIVHADPSLPKATVDASQIQQVLTNLLVNAMQAMASGGLVTIELSARTDPALDANQGGQELAISIRDTGPGIPASDLPHLFEPFFTTKDTGEGTGLGLSIAYGIVQEHGGRIEVVSELGRGSIFTVVLPAEESTCQAM